MAQPPPLITITDPLRPAPARDVLGAEPPARWSWAERGLALAVGLLLVVGVASTSDLRRRAQLQRRADQVQVSARVDPGSPTQLSAADRLGLTIAFRATDQALLSHLQATGGWTPTGELSSPLSPGSDSVVTFDHAIDCSTPLTGPSSVRATLTLDGARKRTVDLKVDGLPTGLGGVACGDLPPGEALTLEGTTVLRDAGRSTVSARLANASTSPLTITEVSFFGFSFRPARPLPLTLPPRPPGVLRRDRLTSAQLVLDAVVSSCGAARAGLDRAVGRGLPDQVTFLGTGVGGPFAVQLRVPGLETYLEAEWDGTCGG